MEGSATRAVVPEADAAARLETTSSGKIRCATACTVLQNLLSNSLLAIDISHLFFTRPNVRAARILTLLILRLLVQPRY